MSRLQHDEKSVQSFMCANCSTSITMSVDESRLIEIDGRKHLVNERCWCDNEHGILVQISKR